MKKLVASMFLVCSVLGAQTKKDTKPDGWTGNNMILWPSALAMSAATTATTNAFILADGCASWSKMDDGMCQITVTFVDPVAPVYCRTEKNEAGQQVVKCVWKTKESGGHPVSDEQVKGIQRYDVVFRVDDEGEGYRKVKDVNGAYVLFKDHKQALAALKSYHSNVCDNYDKALAALEARNKELEERYALPENQGLCIGFEGGVMVTSWVSSMKKTAPLA